MRRLVIEDCRLPAVDQSIEGRSRVFLSVRLRPEGDVREYGGDSYLAISLYEHFRLAASGSRLKEIRYATA